MATSNSIWKPLEGFESSYEYSNLGELRSVDRIVVRPNGVKVPLKGKLLKPIYRKQYYSYDVQVKGKRTRYELHRLVWQWYNGEIIGSDEIHHKDEDKLNNDISNLELIAKRMHMYEHKKAIVRSVYPGVSWYSDRQKWGAQIYFKKRSICLGYRENEDDAYLLYYKALKEFNEGLDLNLLYPKKVAFGGVYKVKNRYKAIYKKQYLGSFVSIEDAWAKINLIKGV